jgi:cytochrome c-type biogenesis protein CcmF
VKEVGAKFRLENLDPEKGKFTIGVSQMNPDDHFIIMKAIIFPYIKLLWIGVFVMVAGFLLSISRRIKDGKKQHAIQEA